MKAHAGTLHRPAALTIMNMIPPDVFDTAVSVLSQHQLFISDITEILQREPDYLTHHFHTSWMWIVSILAVKKIPLPSALPKQAEVEKLVRAAIARSAKDTSGRADAHRPSLPDPQ